MYYVKNQFNPSIEATMTIILSVNGTKLSSFKERLPNYFIVTIAYKIVLVNLIIAYLTTMRTYYPLIS